MHASLSIRALAALALALSGCAHATADPWANAETREALERAWSEPGRICQVRVENHSDTALRAGYRSGSTRMSLGVLQLDGALEFGVPCAHRSVTVFVIRTLPGKGQEVWVAPEKADLQPLGIRTVVLDYRPGRRNEVENAR